MQASIQHWKLKIAQNKQECEDRNRQLRTEKDHIAKHFQELKAKMNHFRTEEKKRLGDLTLNARNCINSLNDQLGLAEKIIKTSELCRKFETEREKVLPFYLSRDLLNEFEEGELEFGDEDLKEEVRKELTDMGIDEWTYLDNFFKRFNKVRLDHLAIEQEKQRLQRENVQLRSILKILGWCERQRGSAFATQSTSRCQWKGELEPCPCEADRREESLRGGGAPCWQLCSSLNKPDD